MSRVFHDIPARIVGLKRVGFPAWQVKSRQKAADQQLLHAPDAKSDGNYTISIVRNLGKLLFDREHLAAICYCEQTEWHKMAI